MQKNLILDSIKLNLFFFTLFSFQLTFSAQFYAPGALQATRQIIELEELQEYQAKEWAKRPDPNFEIGRDKISKFEENGYGFNGKQPFNQTAAVATTHSSALSEAPQTVQTHSNFPGALPALTAKIAEDQIKAQSVEETKPHPNFKRTPNTNPRIDSYSGKGSWYNTAASALSTLNPIGSAMAHNTFSSPDIPEHPTNAEHGSCYLDDLGAAVLPNVAAGITSVVPVATEASSIVKNGTRFGVALQEKPDNLSHNKKRDQFINAAIKTMAAIGVSVACPPAGLTLFNSKISHVHHKHFDPMVNLPDLQAEDYVDRYVANCMGSAAWDCGAVPARIFTAVTRQFAQQCIHGCNTAEITDDVLMKHYQKSKEGLQRAAEHVHQKFMQAPENIKKMYEEFIKVPVHGTMPDDIQSSGPQTARDQELRLSEQDRQFMAQIIKESVTQTSKEMRKVTQAYKQAQQKQETRNSQLKTLNRTQREQELALQQQEQEELERVGKQAENIAKATGDGLSLLARAYGDKEAARKFKVFGKETKAFIAGSVMVASGNPVLGGIAMGDAFMNLIDGMDDADNAEPDRLAQMEQSIIVAIEDAIRTLSARMKIHTQEIIGEIKDVKQLVGEHRGEVMAEFFKLHANTGNISTALHAIREKMHADRGCTLQVLHQQGQLAAQRHEELSSLFAELPIRQIDTQHHELQTMVQREMTPELLIKIIEKYHFFVSQLASSESLTGSYVSSKNSQRMVDALNDVVTDPTNTAAVCQRLDLLVRMHETMLSRSIAADLKDGISNPLILNKCIKQLTDLIDTFLQSGQCVFTNQKDKDLCMRYLTEIGAEQERCQKTVAWLLDPKLTQQVVAEYKKTVESLREQLHNHNQIEFVKKTREEIKDRLRSIAQVEKEAIQFMFPPQFNKFKQELLALEGSVSASIESVKDNAQQGSIRPDIPRNGDFGYGENPNKVVIFNFHNDLAESIVTYENEIREEDFSSSGIARMLESKQQHWFKIRQDLLNRIDDNLQQHLARADTLTCARIQSNDLPMVQSIIYPAQPDQNHLPLIAPGMLQATAQAKALVDVGQGSMRYTYVPEGKHLIITAWLKHNHIETKNMSWKTADHNDDLQSDEDIYNFWYGGRFSRDDRDTVTVRYGTGAGRAYRRPEDDPCRIINTHRYPSLIEHPGFYTKPLGMPVSSDVSKAAEQQVAINNFFISKRALSAHDLAVRLVDESAPIGQTAGKQDLFYSMICASLAMHNGTLQPHLALTRWQDSARTSSEIRKLLKTNPKEVDISLVNVTTLCDHPEIFVGPHKLLGAQTTLLQKISDMLKRCMQAPVVVPQAPVTIPLEIMDRFDRMERENKRLADQNAQMLQLLAAIHARP